MCCLSLDIKNAFNETIRAAGLKRVWEDSRLRDIGYALHKKLACHALVGLGSGNDVQEAPYQSSEGHVQGAGEAMPMTCLTTDKANKVVNEFLRLYGGMLQAGADDTYLVGPWRKVLEALEMFTALLEEVGLSLNESKTRIYIHQSERTDAFLTAIAEKKYNRRPSQRRR
jgi:hypothetical protein